jgi:hypothetical protein
MESAVGGVYVCVCVYMVTSYTIVKCYATFILLIGKSHFYVSEIQQTAAVNEVILIHQTYQSAWFNSEYFDARVVYTFLTT